ncbi:hypothetical protein TNCV_1031011 [Trichonephila clavipes]|nr:hypothetical protein TNCV_1031011 [Trichonephila clavipes]
MATPGSSFTPTPLSHEENVEVGQPSRANALQWHPTRFNFPNVEVRGATGSLAPVIKNVDKITEIIEDDQHVGCRSIAQELKIDHKRVLDNATPNTSTVTLQKLWDLGWKVLLHPPYSPDHTPNDYYLLVAMQNFQGDKKLGSKEV